MSYKIDFLISLRTCRGRPKLNISHGRNAVFTDDIDFVWEIYPFFDTHLQIIFISYG